MEISYKKKCKILFVFAHPDDESYATGGTIAKYSSAGTETVLACFSRGGKGRRVNPNISPDEEMKAIRTKELEKAISILGIGKKYLFDFPDGELCSVEPGKLEEETVRVIRKERPDIVITFHGSGITGHKDHITISQVALSAFFSAGDPRKFPHQLSNLHTHKPQKLYFWTMTNEQVQTLGADKYIGVPAESVTTIIDTKNFVGTQLKAIRSHLSQCKPKYFQEKEKQLDRFGTDYYIRVYPKFDSGMEMETDLLNGLK